MKNVYRIAGIVVGVSMLLPLAAFAQKAGGNAGSAGAGSAVGQGIQDQDRIQLQDQIRDPSTHTATVTTPLQTQSQDRDQTRLQATTSDTTLGGGQMEQEREQVRLQIRLESTTTPAQNGLQLQQMIQEREQQLAQEASSTPQEDQNIIRNENRVRLAVHALLSAQNMLGGGIGPQVSQIAQEINNSVQVTANAEAQIQSRGFWTRLFFGGDAQAAGTIVQATTQNQTRMQQLTELIAQASTTPAVRTELQAQLQEMQQEQTRLQTLANTEQRWWGLFSWRF